MQSQDRSKNAHLKSLEAAFSAWCEQLESDQVQFESDRILCLGLLKQFTAELLLKFDFSPK